MTEAGEADPQAGAGLSKPLFLILLGLRLAVGWHFLYEGLAKLLTPSWTAAPYLQLARGPLADFFHGLGTSPDLLRLVDGLNMWGLVLVGLALMLGGFTRIASASGIIVLGLYYLAHPPLIQTDYRVPLEGHYLFVNKNAAELLILVVFLILPPGALWGLDRLVRTRRAQKQRAPAGDVMAAAPLPAGDRLNRRETLENLVGVPLLGVLGYAAREKYGWEKVHAVTGATIKLPDASLKDLKGRVLQGTLGTLKVSRLILGGNLIGGGAHARDLIYVSALLRAYNTERKIFETLELAERAGVDTCLLSTGQLRLLNKFRKLNSSKLQAICQVFPRNLLEFLQSPICTPATIQDFMDDIDRAMDYGAHAIYPNGAFTERLITGGRMDVLAKALDRIQSQGYPAGLGGHSIEVPIQCEPAGLQADFYVKSFHHDRYWSAHPRENRFEFSVDGRRSLDHNQFHDNMFDLFPEKTIAVMQGLKKPWIAFKVLAGGAIPPQDGFQFAFENGADFICAGMLDYQIIEDVNIACDVLTNLKSRPRPWCA